MTSFKSIIYKKVPSKDKYVLLFITSLVVLFDLSVSTLTRSLTVLATAFYFLTYIVSIITDLNRYFVPTPITSVLLFSISLNVGLEAVRRIHKPEDIVYNALILIVALLGLLLNCIFFVVQTKFYVKMRSKSKPLKKTSSTESRSSSYSSCLYRTKSLTKPSKNQSFRKFRQSSFDTIESHHSHHHHHHTFPHKSFQSCKKEECITEHKNLPMLFKSESYESIEFDNKSTPFSKNESSVKCVAAISETKSKDDKTPGKDQAGAPISSTLCIEEENFFKSKYEERGSDEMESCFEIRMADEPPKVYRDQCFQINMDVDSEEQIVTDDKAQEAKVKDDKKVKKKSKEKFKSKIPKRKDQIMSILSQNKLQRYKKDINKLANWRKCDKKECKKKQTKEDSLKEQNFVYPGFQKPKHPVALAGLIFLYALPTLMCFICYMKPTYDALLCLISLLPLIQNSLSSLKWSFEYLRYEISKKECT